MAKVATADDTKAKEAAARGVEEWIKRIRDLKNAGRQDEAAKELAAFRNEYGERADALLPADLRAMTAPAKYWPRTRAVTIASIATTSAANRPRRMPRSVCNTSGTPPTRRVTRKIRSEWVRSPSARPMAAIAATGRWARIRKKLRTG